MDLTMNDILAEQEEKDACEGATENQEVAAPAVAENTADEKFDLGAIEKTFTSYKKGQIFDGVVVIKREDGVIFNIGGKNDAFIPVDDFDDYQEVKMGDRFKVLITNQKNEEGLIECSKTQADQQIMATQNAQKLKLGGKFSFVVTDATAAGLNSKMGEYEIFIPVSEISNRFVSDTKKYVGKQFEASATEINRDTKKIIGSIKLLENQIRQTTEEMFWNSIFLNKKVVGKIKKIMPYGCFVEVDGIDCFVHVSNLSYKRISNPEEIVFVGQELEFKVIDVDRENKKVALSLKALEEDPKIKAMQEIAVGQQYEGEVVKILQFGAIVKLESGLTGLLHVSNATTEKQRNIYEVVKLGQKIEVEVVNIDLETARISFALLNRNNVEL